MLAAAINLLRESPWRRFLAVITGLMGLVINSLMHERQRRWPVSVHMCVCPSRVPVCVLRLSCVCDLESALKCVFSALFLLSIHLQQSDPSICRLHSPSYHLSSSFLLSSNLSSRSHTFLSHPPPSPFMHIA